MLDLTLFKKFLAFDLFVLLCYLYIIVCDHSSVIFLLLRSHCLECVHMENLTFIF